MSKTVCLRLDQDARSVGGSGEFEDICVQQIQVPMWSFVLNLSIVRLDSPCLLVTGMYCLRVRHMSANQKPEPHVPTCLYGVTN